MFAVPPQNIKSVKRSKSVKAKVKMPSTHRRLYEANDDHPFKLINATKRYDVDDDYVPTLVEEVFDLANDGSKVVQFVKNKEVYGSGNDKEHK